jgi:predicted alpha/beta hydrolase family esterase
MAIVMLTPLISPNRVRVAREISVRKLRAGGPVLSKAVENPKGLLRRARDLALLIHGFNVDICSAGCSYDHFNRAAGLKWQSRSIPVYWPGDAASRWNAPVIWSKFVSIASYPWQIPRAKLTAQRIADLIISSRVGAVSPLKLSIVAHSLGCRVTLELLRLLRGAIQLGSISVPLTVLMAAAVPRYLVLREAKLRPALEIPKRVMIYHSKNDRTLTYAFRLGQVLERSRTAGWNSEIRSAIGHAGMGFDRPQNVYQKRVKHNHGGYWLDGKIAKKTSRSLRFRPVARPTPRVELFPRISPSRRACRGRRLQSRPILSKFRKGCGECPD